MKLTFGLPVHIQLLYEHTDTQIQTDTDTHSQAGIHARVRHVDLKLTPVALQPSAAVVASLSAVS